MLGSYKKTSYPIGNKLIVVNGEVGRVGLVIWTSGYKLPCIGWMNNKVLLYSTGSYIQWLVINHNGREHVCVCVCVCESESRSVMANFLRPRGPPVHGILQARILEWVAFPFARGIFPTQGSNSGLPHCRQILYQLSHKGSPRILEWVAYPFSSRSSRPRNWTRVSCIAGRFLPAELPGKRKSL